PATGSGWAWPSCGASPRRTAERPSPRTGAEAAPGWGSPCASRRTARRSGLLEHCADDPPDHSQLGPVPPAQVVAELRHLIAAIAVEVVEERAERHVQAGGELVHRLQRRGEGAALDPAHRVHRELAPLGQLLLGQLPGVPQRADVDAETFPD